MANRFQKNQHHLAYAFLVERDGEHCIICHKNQKQAKLQIDHADNNPDNWEPENLHLMCQKHNIELRNKPLREKIRIVSEYSANNVSMRERARGIFTTSFIKSTVDYQQGSPEMQVNAYAEEQWREWILSEITKYGFILREVAVYTGAELFGVSGSTVERYLRKLAHPRAKVVIERDAMGAKVIRYRNGGT